MAKEWETDKLGQMTPQDMMHWLEGEIRDISKEAELRIQEATSFVMAYALGKVSPEQMELRNSIYRSRWGEPRLAGLFVTDKMANDEILRRLDSSLPKTVREDIKRDVELSRAKRHR